MLDLFNDNVPWTSQGGDAASMQKKIPASVEMQIQFLEANLGKALMINEALWELIRDKLHLTEKEFFDKLYEIDMRDGTIDGKNQRPVVECPKCHRRVSSRHAACIYCGQILDDSVFQMSK
jgi:hypothetical protein